MKKTTAVDKLTSTEQPVAKKEKRKYTKRVKVSQEIVPTETAKITQASLQEARQMAEKTVLERIAIDHILIKLDEAVRHWQVRTQANCLTGQDIQVWAVMIDAARQISEKIESVNGHRAFMMLSNLLYRRESSTQMLHETKVVASRIRALYNI